MPIGDTSSYKYSPCFWSPLLVTLGITHNIYIYVYIPMLLCTMYSVPTLYTITYRVMHLIGYTLGIKYIYIYIFHDISGGLKYLKDLLYICTTNVANVGILIFFYC